MSRIYDALKKAERRPAAGSAAPPVNGRATIDDGRDVDGDTRLEYERIQMWLTNRSPDTPPMQAVMIASCRRGHGATTTAAGVAATLARRPAARVLIVDANLRTPGLDQLFGARNRAGFSELLNSSNGGGEYIQPTTQPNLFVLTTGQTSGSAPGIFSPAALARLVAYLKSSFDFIVFDASPLLDFPDCYALVPHVDAVVLVVEADRTLVDDARRALRELERSGARAAGVVLNRQRDYTPRLLRRTLFRTNGSRPLPS
jgi:capsular exopolysaccharide synthesis family protein